MCNILVFYFENSRWFRALANLYALEIDKLRFVIMWIHFNWFKNNLRKQNISKIVSIKVTQYFYSTLLDSCKPKVQFCLSKILV